MSTKGLLKRTSPAEDSPVSSLPEGEALEKAMSGTASKPSKPDFEFIPGKLATDTICAINSDQLKLYLKLNRSQLINFTNYDPSLKASELNDEVRALMESASRFNILDVYEDATNQVNWWYNPEMQKYGDAKQQSLGHKFKEECYKQFKLIVDYFSKFTETDELEYSLLNLLLTKGKVITFTDSNNKVIATKVNDTTYKSGLGGRYLQVEGAVISHDGEKLAYGQVTHNIPAYKGKKSLRQLGISLLADAELVSKLVTRGKKYVSMVLKSPNYLQFEGSLIRRTWMGPIAFSATGRVEIDRLGMTKMDPNYSYYFGKADSDYDCYDNSDSEESDLVLDVNNLSDKDYVLMVPYCYGFSFKAKVWGELDVDNLSEIKFRTDSYDRLVLDEGTKKILFSLVQSNEPGRDIIDNKGGGCIFLLHGPPGVGK